MAQWVGVPAEHEDLCSILITCEKKQGGHGLDMLVTPALREVETGSLELVASSEFRERLSQENKVKEQ